MKAARYRIASLGNSWFAYASVEHDGAEQGSEYETGCHSSPEAAWEALQAGAARLGWELEPDVYLLQCDRCDLYWDDHTIEWVNSEGHLCERCRDEG